MAKTPRGKCPICKRTLNFDGTFVSCPHGDYKADGQSFESRWQQYFKAVEGKKAGEGVAEAVSLTSDLKALNVMENK